MLIDALVFTTCTFLGVLTLGWCSVRICFVFMVGFLFSFLGLGGHKRGQQRLLKAKIGLAFCLFDGRRWYKYFSFSPIHSLFLFLNFLFFLSNIFPFCRFLCHWGSYILVFGSSVLVGLGSKRSRCLVCCFCLTTFWWVRGLVLFRLAGCFAGFCVCFTVQQVQ
jgi:hypothetical protein